MKTLTAKLAVAALLVAGSVQANVYVNTGMFVINANDAIQTATASWYSVQQGKTKLQRATGAAVNYGLPAAQFVAAAVLAARASGYTCNDCKYTPDFVKAHFTAPVAAAGLTMLTLGKYLYSNRTDAQVVADAAAEAAVAAAAQSATATAQADASKRRA